MGNDQVATETLAEREKRRIVRYAIARVKIEGELIAIDRVFYQEVAPDAAVYQAQKKEAIERLCQDEEKARDEDQRNVALANFYRAREAARVQFMKNTDAARRKYDQAIRQCASDLLEVQREIDEDFV